MNETYHFFICPNCGAKKYYTCTKEEWGYKLGGMLFCRYNCMVDFEKKNPEQKTVRKPKAKRAADGERQKQNPNNIRNAQIIDLTGQRFGKLTVIRLGECKSRSGAFWECLCDCGNTKLCRSFSLRKGWNKTCGCGKKGGIKK